MIDEVFQTGMDVVEQIRSTQKESLNQAAHLIAEAFLNDRHFFVTGSGHSHTVTEEFYGRAGGLAFVVPILTGELTLTEHPTKSSYVERLPGYAAILVQLYKITEGDVIVIASNSGRNAYPVEMALECKKRGATVIAITSTRHSRATTSRHESGKHLLDIADVVIDNCGEAGDCIMELEGLDTLVCPTSSMANSFIVQAVTVKCASVLMESGIKPPVFVSLNSMGTEHVNDKYFEQYTRMY